MKKLRVTCLGTGDAFSAEGRFQSSYLVESPEGTLLLDCGSMILASMKKLNLPLEPADMILLSHLHGDHMGGLPFLFLHYMCIEPRVRPLIIAGPPGVENRVRMLFEATYPDTAAEPFPFELQFIEAAPACPIVCKDMRIEFFPVRHTLTSGSFGCIVTAGSKKIVYTGDSGWTEEFIALTKDADLFLCECTYFESRSDTHLDYPRIIENLPQIGAQKIILTHLGPEVLARKEEITLKMAHDGFVIDL